MLILFPVILIGVVILFACGVVLKLATAAVAFSKAAFSLFVALVLHTYFPMEGSVPLVSYLQWAGICLVACFALCLLPRFNCGLQFFCTAAISYFVVELVLMFLAGIVFSLFGYTYEPILPVEIGIKVLCALMTAVAWSGTASAAREKRQIRVPVLAGIERLLASVLYGLGMLLLGPVAMNNLWVAPEWIYWCVFLGTTVVAFVLDLFCQEQMQALASWLQDHFHDSTGYGAPCFAQEEPERESFLGSLMNSANDLMDSELDLWDDKYEKMYDGFGNKICEEWEVE